MRQFIRQYIVLEPFVHFLILGALIFAASHYWNADRSRYRIVVGNDEVHRLTVGFEKQYGVAPTASQLQSLIDHHIREEILFREGEALDLAAQDQIVRRRVAQKFEFLQLDNEQDETPSEADIERYYREHADRYLAPARVALTHVFFREGGARDAQTVAQAALVRLQASKATRASTSGDRFAGLYDYDGLSKSDLARVFGESDFVERAFDAPNGLWVGPVRSAYGWHLLRVTGRYAGGTPPLAEVRERVLADLIEQRRQARTEAAFARLRSRYSIVLTDATRA